MAATPAAANRPGPALRSSVGESPAVLRVLVRRRDFDRMRRYRVSKGSAAPIALRKMAAAFVEPSAASRS